MRRRRIYNPFRREAARKFLKFQVLINVTATSKRVGCDYQSKRALLLCDDSHAEIPQAFSVYIRDTNAEPVA